MIDENVLNKVSALCRKYSSPLVRGQEVMMGGQTETQLSVLQAKNVLAQLAGELHIKSGSVFPVISDYLKYLEDSDVKFFKRSDFVKMLIDGMPALSAAYEEKEFVQAYGEELADHVDPNKVLDQQLDS
ncbi:MAG: hypothetical protein NVSMB39_7570 [Candidatus Saccharimonadales bacterium]